MTHSESPKMCQEDRLSAACTGRNFRSVGLDQASEGVHQCDVSRSEQCWECIDVYRGADGSAPSGSQIGSQRRLGHRQFGKTSETPGRGGPDCRFDSEGNPSSPPLALGVEPVWGLNRSVGPGSALGASVALRRLAASNGRHELKRTLMPN